MGLTVLAAAYFQLQKLRSFYPGTVCQKARGTLIMRYSEVIQIPRIGNHVGKILIWPDWHSRDTESITELNNV